MDAQFFQQSGQTMDLTTGSQDTHTNNPTERNKIELFIIIFFIYSLQFILKGNFMKRLLKPKAT